MNRVRVSYQDQIIQPGSRIDIDITKDGPPDVQWHIPAGDFSLLYTIIMYDMDAPYPSPGNTLSPLLHWLVINVTGHEREGDIIADYNPPDPPRNSPDHTYVIEVYNQTNGPLSLSSNYDTNMGFPGNLNVRRGSKYISCPTSTRIIEPGCAVARTNFPVSQFTDDYYLQLVGSTSFRTSYTY